MGRVFWPLLLVILLIAALPLGAHAGGHSAFDDEEGWVGVDAAAPYISRDGKGFSQPSTDASKGVGPLTLDFLPGENSYHLGSAVFQNRLAYGPETPEEFHFVVGDKVVIIKLQMGNGDEPDTMSIIPPEGYIAIPGSVVVEENDKGIIEVYLNTLG